MAKSLVWYEVIDLTSYVVKYPKDWYERNGRNYNRKVSPVFENLGSYSTVSNADARLKKWASEKGIDYDQNISEIQNGWYFEDDGEIVSEPLFEVGIWYDMDDKQVTDPWERIYGTGAMIVKKTLEVDKEAP